MRKAFLDTITELAAADPSVMLLTADTGFHVFDEFRLRFADRFFNVGISEATMIGMAAGLAMEGRKVFVYAIAPFATLRCLEQIRVDLCYQNLPVKVVGVGAGLTYGPAGPTHHTIEDIAVLRCLPNMTVYCPGDPVETCGVVRASMDLDGPAYLRLGKSGEQVVHVGPPPVVVTGRGITLSEGREVTLIATGSTLPLAVEAGHRLTERGISTGVVSMPTVKPLDRELVLTLAASQKVLAVVEEHSVIGGLGAAVAEIVSEQGLPVKLIRFGIPDCFATVAGSQGYWRQQYGFSASAITERIEEVVVGGGV